MYAMFAEVIGLEAWEGKQLSGDPTAAAIIGKLRYILGTDELNRLRGELVTRASRNVKDSH
jgi:hypothetical protein